MEWQIRDTVALLLGWCSIGALLWAFCHFERWRDFSTWLIWEFSGARFVYSLIWTRSQASTSRPPTFLIWLIGIYVTFYGITAEKQARQIHRINNLENLLFSQLSSEQTRIAAFGELKNIYEMPCPDTPELSNPWSVLDSFFYHNERYVNFSNLLIRAVTISKANLEKIDLRNTDLSHAYLSEANMKGALLQKARMHETFLMQANLEGAILSDTDLKKAFLRRANLNMARMSHAILDHTDLGYAEMNMANLRMSRCRGSNFGGAKLRKAEFWGADLLGANFMNADLEGAQFFDVKNVNAQQLCQATSLQGAQFNNKEFKERLMERCPEKIR